MAQSIQRHIAESDEGCLAGNENWWKVHEATMLALGSVHSLLENQIESGNVEFDIKGFLENVVLRDVTNPHGNFEFLKISLSYF